MSCVSSLIMSSLSLLIDAKLMRLFNVLNVESLSKIVSQLKLGASDEKALVNALINRLFVLKEYEKAMSLLPNFLSKLDAAKQRDVLQIMEIGLSAPTSLAIAILSIQEKTVWITNSNYIPDISIQTELDWKSGRIDVVLGILGICAEGNIRFLNTLQIGSD